MEKHTSPRESKAEIRNSIAPIRLLKRGIIFWSLRNALACDVYASTLKIFFKSEADSIDRPSSALALICEIE